MLIVPFNPFNPPFSLRCILKPELQLPRNEAIHNKLNLSQKEKFDRARFQDQDVTTESEERVSLLGFKPPPFLGEGTHSRILKQCDPRWDKWVNGRGGRGRGKETRAERGTRRTDRVLGR